VIPSTLAGNAHPNLKAGSLGKLSVIYTGPANNAGNGNGTEVPIAVWNGTSRVVKDIQVSGSAMLGSEVAGSGSSQDIDPPNLEPHQVGFGYVFFQTTPPAGATFKLAATSEGQFSNTLPVQVDQANYVPGGPDGVNTVVGSISNPNGVTVTGPINTDVFCFTNGLLTNVETGFASGNGDLPPSGTGSYSTQVFDACPTYLVGASGFTG
jgi:hypothetical protein